MFGDAVFKCAMIYLGFAILWQIQGWEKRHAAQVLAIHKLENPGLYRADTPEDKRAIAEVEAHERRWNLYGSLVLFGLLTIGAILYFLFHRT